MKSKIKPIKRLALACIGFYMVIKFSTLLIQWPNGYLLHMRTLEYFSLRATMCCTALIYHFYLQKQKRLSPKCAYAEEFAKDTERWNRSVVIPSCTHGYKLTICTILLQLLMSFSLLLLSSIKEALWGPSLQPILHFTSKVDFLYRGVIEIVCMTAILEELLFRSILEKLLGKVTSSRLPITLIGAVVFSLMHGNMSNNLFYFIMGCFLSYLYHQTQNIIYPMLAHGLHNLCGTSMIYFALEESIGAAINSLPMPIRIALAIGLLIGVYRYMTYMLVSDKRDNGFI